MDGFKLLEHIGLELDLPVISAHPSLNMLRIHPGPLACQLLPQLILYRVA